MNTLNPNNKLVYLSSSIIKNVKPLKPIKFNWPKKRMTLHFIWALLNLTILSFCFKYIIGSDWEVPFVIATFFYCSVYWMLTTIIFDKLIGDKSDNL